MIRQTFCARCGTAFRWLLCLTAVSAAAIACEGTSSTSVPQPDLPVQPAEIIKISGDHQEGRPGDRLQPLIVAVRDASGKPVAGVRVRFSVTAGDGFAALILVSPGGDEWVARYRGPADQVTNSKGEALVLWFLGRHGENQLVANVEIEGKSLEVSFRASSLSSGYAGGSFALTSTGTSVKLYDALSGPYDCIVKSGSLVLSRDGSFEGAGDFNCAGRSFSAIETGLYAVSGSTIVLHYLDSNDTVGLFGLSRDVHGVMSEDKIAFSSLGAEWRYARLVNVDLH